MDISVHRVQEVSIQRIKLFQGTEVLEVVFVDDRGTESRLSMFLDDDKYTSVRDELEFLVFNKEKSNAA
jgi:hypothetical protein